MRLRGVARLYKRALFHRWSLSGSVSRYRNSTEALNPLTRPISAFANSPSFSRFLSFRISRAETCTTHQIISPQYIAQTSSGSADDISSQCC